MARFVFRLEALLKYRRHRRDLCRTLLAQLLEGDRQLDREQLRIESERRDQLLEIRDLGREESVDVDRAASRRYYAGQLGVDMKMIERQRSELGERIELCRKALVEADRDVKVLEKLEDKQRGEYEFEQQRRRDRDLEDVWFSAHAMEYSQ